MNIPKYYIDFRKIVNEILNTQHKSSLKDMTCVKRERISTLPIVFYNNCKMYFDESSLPLSCADVTDLSNKCVLYGIFCKGKFYIGSTTDFGERMATHIKDSKKNRRNKTSQRLYHDMVKSGQCLSFVLAIVNTEKELKKLEHKIIDECKKYSLYKACNFNENAIRFINEGINDSKEYELKYCFNIAD